MSYSITKSVSTDFSSGVNECLLHAEVDSNSSITTTFEGIRVSGDNCEIVFVSEPTAGEKTTVDSIVSSHSGTNFEKAEEFYDGFEGEALTARWETIIDNDGSTVPEAKTGGVHTLKTGTNDNDKTTIWLSDTSWLTAADDVTFEARIRLPYTTWLEVYLGVINPAFTNGFYIKSKSSTNNYHAVTESSDTQTDTDTGIGYKNTNWHTIKIISSACQVKFYINGALEATHTTNISTTPGSPFFRIKTTDNNTVRQLQIDYLRLISNRPTS